MFQCSMFECFSFESLKFNFVWLPTGTWAPDRDAETDSSAERREHQETVGNASEQRRGWVGHLNIGDWTFHRHLFH
jgi:hypothetical protein